MLYYILAAVFLVVSLVLRRQMKIKTEKFVVPVSAVLAVSYRHGTNVMDISDQTYTFTYNGTEYTVSAGDKYLGLPNGTVEPLLLDPADLKNYIPSCQLTYYRVGSWIFLIAAIGIAIYGGVLAMIAGGVDWSSFTLSA